MPIDAQLPRFLLSYAQCPVMPIQGPTSSLPLNVLAVLMELRAPFSLGSIRRAAGAAVSRHDGLRLRLEQPTGALPRQWIADDAPPEVPLITVLDEPEAFAWAQAQAQLPFTFTGEPLIAMAHLQSQRKGWLFIKLHHLLADGWTVGKLCADIVEGIRLAQSGYEPSERDRSPSFIDVLLEEALYLRSPNMARDRARCVANLERCDGFPTLFAEESGLARAGSFLRSLWDYSKPCDLAVEEVREVLATDTVYHALPASLQRKFRAQGENLGVTDFEQICAVFAKWLSLHRPGQPRTVLVVGHGRVDQLEVFGQLSHCHFFSLPDGNGPNPLAECRRRLLEQLDWGRFPYLMEIKEAGRLGFDFDPTRIVCLASNHSSYVAEKGLRWLDPGYSFLPFSMHVNPLGDSGALTLKVTYHPTLYKRLEIELLLRQIQDIIADDGAQEDDAPAGRPSASAPTGPSSNR